MARRKDNERELEAEVVTGRFEADVACHDYRHLGWRARKVRINDLQYKIMVRWGRVKHLRCCYVKRRSYIREKDPGKTWVPRDGHVNVRRRWDRAAG